jgi:hypothetical protein
MFLLLLISSTLVALGAALLTVRFFDAAILRILHTILGAELASAWQRYLRFAIVVVGVSGGVRPLDLEKYIAPNRPGATAPELSLERWTLASSAPRMVCRMRRMAASKKRTVSSAAPSATRVELISNNKNMSVTHGPPSGWPENLPVKKSAPIGAP